MTPDANDDFVDVVAALAAERCAFVIVGAHALAAHGAPRATGDLDVWRCSRSCGRGGGERAPAVEGDDAAR